MKRSGFRGYPGDPPDDERPSSPLEDAVLVLLEDAGIDEATNDTIVALIEAAEGRKWEAENTATVAEEARLADAREAAFADEATADQGEVAITIAPDAFERGGEIPPLTPEQLISMVSAGVGIGAMQDLEPDNIDRALVLTATLAPCPFCGGRPVTINRLNSATSIHRGIVSCDRCMANVGCNARSRHLARGGAMARWQARAAQTQPPGDTGTVADIPDVQLLERAVRNCIARTTHEKRRWVAVMDTFALGSTYAAQLCRRFGVDPDAPTPRRRKLT
jgi:hypothetical protein